MSEVVRRAAIVAGISASILLVGLIMIHGLPNRAPYLGRLHRRVDWTDGCIALTNREIEQVWQAVDDGTVIEIRP